MAAILGFLVKHNDALCILSDVVLSVPAVARIQFPGLGSPGEVLIGTVPRDGVLNRHQALLGEKVRTPIRSNTA